MSDRKWMCYRCGRLSGTPVCEHQDCGSTSVCEMPGPSDDDTAKERVAIINEVSNILKGVMDIDRVSTDPKDGGDLIERYDLALDRLELFRIAVHKAVEVLVNGAT